MNPKTRLLFDRRWNHPAGLGGFDLYVDSAHRALMVTEGKGTMAGARASIATLEEGLATLGQSPPFTGIVDVRDVTGSPLRAQVTLGRWLLRHRHVFGRIAVLGAAPWEARLGHAIAHIARMQAKVSFVATERQGRRFLGWGDEAPWIADRHGAGAGAGERA